MEHERLTEAANEYLEGLIDENTFIGALTFFFSTVKDERSLADVTATIAVAMS